jgi:putative protease
MANTLCGTITHYYDKIGVAVVDIKKTLEVGDKIKLIGHDQEFEQEVASMQTEHQQIKSAKKGLSIGLKVDQPVKEGTKVFLVST